MTISFYNEIGQITGELSGDVVAYVLDDVKRIPPPITTPGLPPFPTGKRLWVEGAWYGKPVYVLNGEIINKPNHLFEINGSTLTDLVHPCTIAINGTEYHCDSSTADLELFHPGVYKVKVTVWPYLDREFAIENPA